MEVRKGYKQTEVGVIPEDWLVDSLINRCDYADYRGKTPRKTQSGVFLITARNVRKGFIDYEESKEYVSVDEYEIIMRRGKPQIGDVLITTEAPLGNVAQVDREDIALAQRIIKYRPKKLDLSSNYLKHYLLSDNFQKILEENASGSTAMGIKGSILHQLLIALPPTPAEQEAIAVALSDMDALLTALDALIAKKRLIKQGAMQELLTCKKRLPGFSGEWEEKTLGEIADCLDNLRIPLNDSQRNKMKGDYPYCGANGVLDYIDRYCVDDSVILIAEDGGYFDEYMTRPIAYRMAGKFWVNNHAHILKSKSDFDQDFLFHSLVHKNILSYLANGTRAKLNKSELNKIVIRQSTMKAEQTAIAAILSDLDAEITALEQRREKTRLLKQGMMQELLTGKTRLV